MSLKVTITQQFQDFRIRFNLVTGYDEVIDKWLQFAIGKKVEMLELDLMEQYQRIPDPYENYDFPQRLLDRNNISPF